MGSCSSTMASRSRTRATAKKHAAAPPQLHEELWLEVLRRVPEQDILDSAMLVSRTWRKLCVERTSTEAVLEHCETCTGCGAKSWPAEEIECHFWSFLAYVRARVATLERVTLCPCRLTTDQLASVVETLKDAPRLCHLHVNSNSDARFRTEDLKLLPLSLESLIVSLQGEQLCEAACLNRLTNLTALELGQRESMPLASKQLQQVCELTQLRQLRLHARWGNSLPDHLSQLQLLEELEVEALPELTSGHVRTLLRMPALQALVLRDMFSLRQPIDTLKDHPGLRDVLIQCTSASEEGSMSIFKIPQVTVFRCNGFQYDVPTEVTTPGAVLGHHGLQSLSLTLHTAAVDLPALLAAPQLSSLELRCHKVRLVNAGGIRALGADARRLDCLIASATEISSGDQTRLRKAGFKVDKHVTEAGPQWIAQYLSPED